MKMSTLRASTALTALLALRCGSEDAGVVPLAERAARGDDGHVSADGTDIEFVSTPATELSGVVGIDVSSERLESPLSYELRYDYAVGTVTADGHGGRLDRASLRVLNAAAQQLAAQLGPDAPELPLHEQMLFAAFVLLGESGGMPLTPLTFDVSARARGVVDKALGNDGVGCIRQGTTYLVSFDFDDTVVVDTPIVADSHSCNGMCGPSCTQLTPWSMWTLDCLEHDSCCSAIGDDTTCWTPLGECGNEYADAEADFLRGFDPFARHCSG